MTIKERIDRAKQKEYLSVEDVSLLLTIHPVTIYKKALRNEIPGMVRFGRSLRFRRVLVLQPWPTPAELRERAAESSSSPA